MMLITAIELGTNYPENIMISAAKQSNGKFKSFCYMTRDGEIHKLMLRSQPDFETEEEANDVIHKVAVECKEKYGGKDLVDIIKSD